MCEVDQLEKHEWIMSLLLQMKSMHVPMTRYPSDLCLLTFLWAPTCGTSHKNQDADDQWKLHQRPIRVHKKKRHAMSTECERWYCFKSFVHWDKQVSLPWLLSNGKVAKIVYGNAHASVFEKLNRYLCLCCQRWSDRDIICISPGICALFSLPIVHMSTVNLDW